MEKQPEMWSSGNWFLHPDNVPVHTALSVQHFLAKNNMIVIPHPPYSPDLTPCDFFLFPCMKGQMKGNCFVDVKENAGGLEQHQHGRVPEMFSPVEKTLVQVYQVQRRVL